jgi:hypothetical protein
VYIEKTFINQNFKHTLTNCYLLIIYQLIVSHGQTISREDLNMAYIVEEAVCNAIATELDN